MLLSTKMLIVAIVSIVCYIFTGVIHADCRNKYADDILMYFKLACYLFFALACTAIFISIIAMIFERA